MPIMALRLFIVFLKFYGACEELLIQEAGLRFILWFRYLFFLYRRGLITEGSLDQFLCIR